MISATTLDLVAGPSLGVPELTHAHTGGDHQMCMQHQYRLSKKDFKYTNPKGDVLEFLTALNRLDYNTTCTTR